MPEMLAPLRAAVAEVGGAARLVHGGEDRGVRGGVDVRPWSALDDDDGLS